MKKLLLTILLLILITGCTDIQPRFGVVTEKRAKVKENIKLKVPKEKHLFVEKKDGVASYLYISDKKIKKEKLVKDGKIYNEYKRTRNAIIYKIDKPELLGGVKDDNIEYFVGRFYGGSPFYQEPETGDWYQTETSTTTIEVYDSATSTEILGASGDYIYGAEDGRVRYYLSTSWNTSHDASTGDSFTWSSTRQVLDVESGIISSTYIIYRAFLPILTSEIPADSTIVSASFNIVSNGGAAPNNDGKAYIGLVQTTQANSNALVTSDYNQCGAVDNPTLGSDDKLAITSLDTTGDLGEYTINSTGLGWIKKNGETSNCGSTAGYTCLGLREGHDIEDCDGTKCTTVTGRNYVSVRSVGYTGTDSDPYLEVTYTTGGASRRTMLIN